MPVYTQRAVLESAAAMKSVESVESAAGADDESGRFIVLGPFFENRQCRCGQARQENSSRGRLTKAGVDAGTAPAGLISCLRGEAVLGPWPPALWPAPRAGVARQGRAGASWPEVLPALMTRFPAGDDLIPATVPVTRSKSLGALGLLICSVGVGP